MYETIPLANPNLPLGMTFELAKQLSLGKYTEMLECHWPTTNRHKIACSSGTVALAIAIRAAIDESCYLTHLLAKPDVICSAYTFGATVLAIRQAGFYPVFADCNDMGLIDFKDVYRILGERRGLNVAAVVGTNAFGLPVDSCDVTEFRGRYPNIPVILDNAQGVGSFVGVVDGGRHPTISEATAETFSMSPTKVVTASEGGMIAVNDRQIARRCRSLRLYGRGYEGHTLEVDFQKGFSARMSELCAQLGLYSLSNLQENMKIRREIYGVYNARLPMMPIEYTSRSVVHESGLNYAVTLLPEGVNVKYVIAAMKLMFIETRNYFLSYGGHGTPVADNLSVRSLALPLHTDMSPRHADYVARSLKDILKDESHSSTDIVR